MHTFRAGVTLPTVEVRYDNLNIEAKVQVGGRALPTLANAALNAFEVDLASTLPQFSV